MIISTCMIMLLVLVLVVCRLVVGVLGRGGCVGDGYDNDVGAYSCSRYFCVFFLLLFMLCCRWRWYCLICCWIRY